MRNAPRHIVRLSCAAFAALALLAGCTTTRGSGVSATESRTVDAFERVDVSGAATAEFSIGVLTPLSVTADDNILPLIITEVRDGCLYIYTRESTSSRVPVRVTGTIPKLTGVDCSGATTARIRGLAGDELLVRLSGASNCEAAGKVKKVKVDASGASNAVLGELVAQTVQFDVSGASKLLANATNELRGDASGASDVRYRGKPGVVKTDITGASKVGPTN